MGDIDPAIAAQMEKEGLGPFLRRVREAKGISLRDVSDQTRIRVHYLESIESGSFDRLPTGPIGVGFVRAFAEAVGADAGAAAAAFKRETAIGLGLGRQEPEADADILLKASRRQGRVNSAAALLFILLFLLASGGVLWFVKGKTAGPLASVESIADAIKAAFAPAADAPPPQAKRANGGDQGAKMAAPGEAGEEKAPDRASASDATIEPPGRESASLPASSAAEGSRPPAGDAPPEENPLAQENLPSPGEVAVGAPTNGEGAPPEPRDAPRAAAPPLALRIFAVEDTWLRIVVDAKDPEEFLLSAGGERNWRASEKFVLTLGNVAGAQVSLNGEKIALPRNPSNVLRDFTITRQSLN